MGLILLGLDDMDRFRVEEYVKTFKKRNKII
jgi:hypothetical protein